MKKSWVAGAWAGSLKYEEIRTGWALWPPSASSKTRDLPGLDTRSIPGYRTAKPRHALWLWDLPAGVKSFSSDTRRFLRLNLPFCREGITLRLPHKVMGINFEE